MKDSPFRLAPLGAEHDRGSFHCGEEALDRYFHTQATQDIRRRIANCFVAVDAVSASVAAYYTIAAAGIPLVELPPEEAKRLPRYPTVLAVRSGRLAVDQKVHGRGLGGALLVDAARRSIQSKQAVYALLVEAKNDHAVAFGLPRTLFLPATAEKALFAGRRSLSLRGDARASLSFP